MRKFLTVIAVLLSVAGCASPNTMGSADSSANSTDPTMHNF